MSLKNQRHNEFNSGLCITKFRKKSDLQKKVGPTQNTVIHKYLNVNAYLMEKLSCFIRR